MRIRTLLGFLVLAAVMPTGDAFAGKKDATEQPQGAADELAIQKTGLASMDQFFGQVQGQLDRLHGARRDMQTGSDNLAVALGLATGTPVQSALQDLRSKAQGKVKVALDGRVPKLQASDAVPENVQKGIDAVNTLVDADLAAAAACQEVATQAGPLAQEAPGMVGRVPAEAKSAGLKVTEIPGVTKKVKHNVDVTRSLPDEAQKTLTVAQGNVDLVATTFAE